MTQPVAATAASPPPPPPPPAEQRRQSTLKSILTSPPLSPKEEDPFARHRCTLCSKDFAHSFSLTRHIKSKHETSPPPVSGSSDIKNVSNSDIMLPASMYDNMPSSIIEEDMKIKQEKPENIIVVLEKPAPPAAAAAAAAVTKKRRRVKLVEFTTKEDDEIIPAKKAFGDTAQINESIIDTFLQCFLDYRGDHKSEYSEIVNHLIFEVDWFIRKRQFYCSTMKAILTAVCDQHNVDLNNVMRIALAQWDESGPFDWNRVIMAFALAGMLYQARENMRDQIRHMLKYVCASSHIEMQDADGWSEGFLKFSNLDNSMSANAF